MDPLTIGALAVGGLAKVGSALFQVGATKKAIQAQSSFANAQRDRLTSGFTSLADLVKQQDVYKGDTTPYAQMTAEAKLQQLAANRGGRVMGEDIAKEQLRQSSANAFRQGAQGARSGVDIMNLAGLNQSILGSQELDIEKQSMQTQTAMQMQKDQQLTAAMAQEAAAKARERGLEFTSFNARQNALLGVEQGRLQSSLGQENMFYEQEARLAGGYADAQAAVMSGVGDIGLGLGKSMMANTAATAQMDNLKLMLQANGWSLPGRK
jgi:hypothetical protein